MLIHFGVTPYLVFDGDYLPSKAATESERKTKREESKKLGLAMYYSGKVAAAHKELQKAIDVTPVMARELIEELKGMDVRYVVAPYEADAQLAYLEQKGIISAVLSEDSDMLVFGTKCLLTKLDQYGDCVEINRKDFTSCREIVLAGWSNAEFRRMAVLRGCDYLRGINGMGLMTAYRLVRKYKEVEKIIRMVQFDGQFHVPEGYNEAFKQAELTFLHQRVFCPLENKLRFLTNLDGEEPEDFDYVGRDFEKQIAIGVAHGDLHPTTKEPMAVVKRRYNGSPRTPFGTKRNSGENHNIKKSQSIEAFFKTKRTPLAELDPNCFTPSPTQLRLQEQQVNATWQSSPASIPPGSSRSTQTLPRPSASGGLRDHSLKNALSRSAALPPKRRRLCDEESSLSESLPRWSNEDVKSKFFQPPRSADSPLVETRRRRKNKSAGGMNIWSDDSIEEAMANLPDIDGQRKTQPSDKVSVFSDPVGDAAKSPLQAIKHEVSYPTENSQLTVSSVASTTSDVSTVTAATSIAEDSISSILDSSVKADLIALSRTPLHEPESPEEPLNEYFVPLRNEEKATISMSTEAGAIPSTTAVSSSKKSHAANLKVTSAEYRSILQSQSRPRLARSNSLTPLGRLGVHALHRSRSLSWSMARGVEARHCGADTATASSSASEFRGRVLSSGSACALSHEPGEKGDGSSTSPATPMGTSSRTARGRIPTVLRNDSRLKSIEKEELALIVKGSEDLLVPDSEGSDAASISDAGTPQKSNLDIKRFAFVDE